MSTSTFEKLFYTEKKIKAISDDDLADLSIWELEQVSSLHQFSDEKLRGLKFRRRRVRNRVSARKSARNRREDYATLSNAYLELYERCTTAEAEANALREQVAMLLKMKQIPL